MGPEQVTAVGDRGSVPLGTCDRPCRGHLGIVSPRDTEAGVFLAKSWGPFEAIVNFIIISYKLPPFVQGRKEGEPIVQDSPGLLNFPSVLCISTLPVQQTAPRCSGKTNNKRLCSSCSEGWLGLADLGWAQLGSSAGLGWANTHWRAGGVADPGWVQLGDCFRPGSS